MFQTLPVILGQYRPLDSFLHHLDARAKILPITFVLILALLTDSFIFYIVILLSLMLALISSGVELKILARNFKPVLYLVIITTLYHLIFSAQDSDVLVSFWRIKITSGGVHLALFYSLRLIIFISVAFLVTLTSSPSELGDAVTKLLEPLEKFRFPVSDLALIIFIAIRFIPILFEEFIAIKNAQIVRGVNFSGSFISRLNKTTSIIIPVFVAAIQRADELALAIEARGYRGGRKRSYYSHLRFGIKEWLFVFGSSGLIFILFYFTK